MITIDASTQAILTAIVIPLLVGLLTKVNASTSIKAVLNFGLSALGGAIAVVVQQPEHSQKWTTFVFAIAITWAVSVATYFGLYKPTPIAQTVNSTPGLIGPSVKKAA